jgi:hypothetical protein
MTLARALLAVRSLKLDIEGKLEDAAAVLEAQADSVVFQDDI